MDKELFDSLVKSMEEMVAIENGEQQPSPERVHRHKLPNVRQVRETTGMKQHEFAQAIGVSPSLVQSWEQARRFPSGAALKILLMLERNPTLINVLTAL